MHKGDHSIHESFSAACFVHRREDWEIPIPESIAFKFVGQALSADQGLQIVLLSTLESEEDRRPKTGEVGMVLERGEQPRCGIYWVGLVCL